jgi:ComEC/Rec2-related protein
LGIASKFSIFAFLPLLLVPFLLRKLSHILGVLLSFGLGYLRIWERTLGERGEFYEVSIYDLGRGFIVGEGFKTVMFGDRPAYPLGNIRAKGEFSGDTFYIYEYEKKLAFKPFVDFIDSLLIRSTGSERQYKFAKSIITGIREIDPETKRKFYETGVGHILAISGLHVGVIYLGIYWLIRFFNLGLYSHIIPSFLVWLYAFFVGFIPSVFRASLMLTFYAISKVISRPVKPLNVFMLSFAVSLLWEPLWIFSVSFWLSFSAVLGFILFPKNLLTSIFGALIFSTPISLYFFGKSALLYAPLNLIVIPLTTLYLYSQILAIFVPYPFANSSELLFNLLYKTVDLASNLNLPPITFNPPLWFIVFYISIILFSLSLWRFKNAEKTG